MLDNDAAILDAKEFTERLSKRVAARIDPKLHASVAPEGYRLKGVSTQVDATGNVISQWIKTATDFEDPAVFVEAFKAAVIRAGIPAIPPISAPPPLSMADLIAWYVMGDPHIGALSWALETGFAFDLKIAEQMMCSAVDKLVSLAPPCETAVLCSVGDNIHMDNQKNETTKGGHLLDVDSRFRKVLDVAFTTYVHMIRRLLENHDRVHGKFVAGNHDGTLSLILPLLVQQAFRDNPRVVIDTTPSPFMWYRFGKCMWGVTHGDKTKIADLAEIMACDRPKDWGETEFRHWYTGHVHHLQTKELRGCTVESMRTLAARDSWHYSHGYRAGREMVLDIWHKDFGRKIRYTVGVEELRPVA